MSDVVSLGVEAVREPLVSVVIPTYNRSSLLGRAIESALAQTYQQIEIVIVDDASEDDTQLVVQGFANENIRYIRHMERTGGAGARNTGIDDAQGTFVAFLDSDDVWLATKLERQLTHVSESRYDPANTLYHAQCISDDGLKKIVLPTRGVRDGESVADYLFGGGGDIPTITMLLSTALARKVRFRPELPRHQDWDFCIRLEQYGARFAFLREPVSTYYRDARPDRIGASDDPSPSIRWVTDPALGIGPGARRAFMAESVAPRLRRQGQWLRPSWLVVRAAGTGSIPISQAGKLMANMYLPPGINSQLKTWYGRVSRRRYNG